MQSYFYCILFTALPGCCTAKVLELAVKFGDIIGGGQ